MDEAPSSRSGVIVAIAALIGVLLGLAALLGIWPFSDEELSEAEFIAQGDAICREAHNEFRSLQERPVRTSSDAADLTGALIQVAEEERAAIDDLNEPSSLTDQVERYLDAREQGIELLRSGREAAENAEAEEYARLQAKLAASQLDPRFAIARRIGFEECSRPIVSRERLRRDAAPPAPTGADAPPTVSNPPTGSS